MKDTRGFEFNDTTGLLKWVTYRAAMTEGDRAFVEGADMFFLATADAAGLPDCSYKGGDPGFVRVAIDRVFPNCPRYIHTMARTERSPYVPRAGETPPEPGWKRDPRFAKALPATKVRGT